MPVRDAVSISERTCAAAEGLQAAVGAAEEPAGCEATNLAHRGGDLWASTGCNDESCESPDVEDEIARKNASHNKHIILQWCDCSLSPLLPSRSDSSLAHSSAPTRRSSSSSLCSMLHSSPRSFAGSMSKKSVRWCLLGMPARERLPRVPWGKLDQSRSLLRSRSSDEVRMCYLRRLGITPPDGPLPEAPPITPMIVSAPQATSMTFLGGWCM